MALPEYRGRRGIAASAHSIHSLLGILIALTLLSTAVLAQNRPATGTLWPATTARIGAPVTWRRHTT